MIVHKCFECGNNPTHIEWNLYKKLDSGSYVKVDKVQYEIRCSTCNESVTDYKEEDVQTWWNTLQRIRGRGE